MTQTEIEEIRVKVLSDPTISKPTLIIILDLIGEIKILKRTLGECKDSIRELKARCERHQW